MCLESTTTVAMMLHMDESGETVGLIGPIFNFAGDRASFNDVHDGLICLLELEDDSVQRVWCSACENTGEKKRIESGRGRIGTSRRSNLTRVR